MTQRADLLRAAKEVFESYGARRATIEDIVRAAGVSRSSLYRVFGCKEDLLAAVLLDEIDQFMSELERLSEEMSLRQAVVECFCAGLQMTQRVPILRKLRDSEPETFVGFNNHATLLLSYGNRVAEVLRRAGATMPEQDLLAASELLLRLGFTYLISPNGRLDVADPEAVRLYAETHLVAVVH